MGCLEDRVHLTASRRAGAAAPHWDRAPQRSALHRTPARAAAGRATCCRPIVRCTARGVHTGHGMALHGDRVGRQAPHGGHTRDIKFWRVPAESKSAPHRAAALPRAPNRPKVDHTCHTARVTVCATGRCRTGATDALAEALRLKSVRASGSIRPSSGGLGGAVEREGGRWPAPQRDGGWARGAGRGAEISGHDGVRGAAAGRPPAARAVSVVQRTRRRAWEACAEWPNGLRDRKRGPPAAPAHGRRQPQARRGVNGKTYETHEALPTLASLSRRPPPATRDKAYGRIEIRTVATGPPRISRTIRAASFRAPNTPAAPAGRSSIGRVAAMRRTKPSMGGPTGRLARSHRTSGTASVTPTSVSSAWAPTGRTPAGTLRGPWRRLPPPGRRGAALSLISGRPARLPQRPPALGLPPNGTPREALFCARPSHKYLTPTRATINTEPT